VGVLAIRVLAAGAVAGPARAENAGDPGSTLVDGNAFTADLARADQLHALLGESDADSMVELALRFALAKPGVSSVLVGLSNREQLDQAIQWAERGPLAAATVERLVATAR
jgi:aryl-alcohol dehydrogenase-like predicted oxidoreductase